MAGEECAEKAANEGDDGMRIEIGTIFKRLTVVGIAAVEHRTKTSIYYRCRCQCGNYTRVTAARLLGGQMSCGCAQGGQRGQHNKPRTARPSGYRSWTPEVGAEALRLHALDHTSRDIAKVLCVPRTTLTRYLIAQGVVSDVGPEIRPKPLAVMPASVRYEDAVPSVADGRGRVPKPVARGSLMGCAAQMCVG